jgi:hypothetical protein
VLLLDEFTVGSETAGKSTAVGLMYSKLLKRAARYTVLMSATVPEFNQLPALLRCFRRAHGEDVQVETVSSRRLSIGVEARDQAGALWLPHHAGLASTDAVSMGEVPDGHLLRFYGPEGLRQMLAELQLSANNELTVMDFVSHDAVRAAALRVMCSHRDTLGRLAVDGTRWEERGSVDAECLATTGAWRFPGCTLVVAEGGSDAFYDQAVRPLLADVPAVRRLMVKQPKERKNRSQKPDSDEDERTEPVASEARVRWPPETVVNSKEHFGKYRRSDDTAAVLAAKHRKVSPNVPDSILETSAVPLVESALGGVVLLDSRWGDRAFELCGLALADSAQPSYIVSDTRLVYGVNLPVNRVLVLLGEDALGTDEVRQLCGRAGRTGKCSKAEVVFRSKRLLQLALSTKQLDTLERVPLDLLIEAQEYKT